MNVDVVALVRDSMEQMGCGSAIAGELDAHSPICIGFNDLPALYVEHEHDKVTLWSKLEYSGSVQVARASADLLDYLLPRGSDKFVCRRPLLSIVDDSLLLHARVEHAFVADATSFTQALEEFYEDLCAVHDILGR